MSSKRFTSDDELSIDVYKLHQQLPEIIGLCLGSFKNCSEVKHETRRGSAAPGRIRPVREVLSSGVVSQQGESSVPAVCEG